MSAETHTFRLILKHEYVTSPYGEGVLTYRLALRPPVGPMRIRGYVITVQ